MKENLLDRTNSINCTSGSIPTCKKAINNFKKIRDNAGGKKEMLEDIGSLDTFRIAGSLDFDQEKDHRKPLFQESTFQFSQPTDYLTRIKHHISQDIISAENYDEIQHLASTFQKNITSFFGFETNLNSTDPRSDYLFAISSKKGEREALLQLLSDLPITKNSPHYSAWDHIYDFTRQWSQKGTEIHENVKGLWFEFDTANPNESLPIPNIFLQTKKMRIDNPQQEKEFQWITKTAIPLLTGSTLSIKAEKKLVESIKNLPPETSLIHVGTMLARRTNGVRIVINRIKPSDIIPYLNSLGFHKEDTQLKGIIKELQHYVSRLILHLNVGEEIDEKIGIECSFSYDQYHEEKNWERFLDYLEQKGLCNADKKEGLLDFVGVELQHPMYSFSSEEYMPSVMIPESQKNQALVRYISHVKVVFVPHKPLMVKAYPGVRLLGSVN